MEWSDLVAAEKTGTLEQPPPPKPKPHKRKTKYPAGSYERVFFWADAHGRYVDRDVWPQILRFVKDYAPHRTVNLGDLIDAYPVSSFSKDPSRVGELQADIDDGHALQRDVIEAAPAEAEHDYIIGNHEQRIERFLWTRAPELASLRCLRLAELLKLKELSVKMHPRSGFLLRENFRCKHGDLVRKDAGASARAEFLSHGGGMSGISGHVHRGGAHEITTRDGRDYVWQEAPCLSRLDPEYVDGHPNWQQGFVLGEFKRGGHRFVLEKVRIVGQRLIYQGKDYS